MTNIDEFESAFKSADKTLFAPEAVDIKSVLVVTDADQESSDVLVERLRRFLGIIELGSQVDWSTLTGDQYVSVSDLLAAVEERGADLICTYRNLRIPSREHPYSLGVYVDVLAQVATSPVLLAPRPSLLGERTDLMLDTQRVMAITDHLTGDHRLVSYAAKFTQAGGTLFLTHIEDEAIFERYLETIGKIPSIDTDAARRDLLEQLLKEPKDYVHSCREVLGRAGVDLHIEEIVILGHRLADYKRLVNEHEIDLLVINTKDENQLAMHGQAYPLAVELRHTPLLML